MVNGSNTCNFFWLDLHPRFCYQSARAKSVQVVYNFLDLIFENFQNTGIGDEAGEGTLDFDVHYVHF